MESSSRKRSWRRFAALSFFSGALACIFSTVAAFAASPAAPAKVVISDQFGPGHLVTVVMKRKKFLEKAFPDTTFKWEIVTSGAVMTDGMLSDQIQIGITAPPPFLIGLNKGIKWKIIAGAATYDQWLVAKDKDIKSLKDIYGDRTRQIAVVALQSFPAIVLRKAAEQEFHNPHALDNQMVVMPPSSAIPALLGGQLAAALMPPISCVQAVDGGAHVVLRSGDVFSGLVTNNFYVMTDDFYQRYPAFAKAFHDAVVQAVQFIKQSPAEAYQMLSEDEGSKIPASKLQDLVTRAGTTFSPVPHRVLEVAEFMQKIGTIKHAPQSMDQIEFPPLGGAGS